MSEHVERIRLQLASGPASARQLLENIGKTGRISQPTLSRALASMGDEVLKLGAARSIHYALRDGRRGLPSVPIYRVDAQSQLRHLGLLVPVYPDGFVMQQADGLSLHHHSLPWWLLDMRPQGFLGRAYASRHAQALGLPAQLTDWTDAHALRALTAHGHDAVGNLLLGDVARERFLATPAPEALAAEQKSAAYTLLAQEAASGEQPGSSAGGEQPKFSAFVQTPAGPCHVLVKFSLPEANPITQRWRDLLLAEHHALETLRSAGVTAARSWVLDHAGQRFLEVERFDRVGALGRCGVVSLASVEAEFVGDASAPWPSLAARLAQGGQITPEAAQGAQLLYAFGKLIGNTDMHNGNLSFLNEHGRPYALAPAYDMLPMGFAPSASGGLRNRLATPQLAASVANAVWAQALSLAAEFLARVRADERFSEAFQPCVLSLAQHLALAGGQVERLG
jgi:hypothetical protein